MFRITRDNGLDGVIKFENSGFYVHKKFLWFWIKWAPYKVNYANNIHVAYYCIKTGKYNFGSGEYADFYYIKDR